VLDRYSRVHLDYVGYRRTTAADVGDRRDVRRLSERPQQDLLGRDDTWLDPDLEPVWRANDLRARDGAYRVEEWADAPDGRRWYESVKFPLYDATSTLYATCGVSLDVTVNKQAALAMEEARDLALQASQQKSSFLANMSHEIRTPMNGVLGMADLLMDSDLAEGDQRLLAMLRESASNLLVVINDILDFSKVESGTLQIEQVSFDLRGLIACVGALFATAAQEKALAFSLQISDDLPGQVTGDPTRLRQIIINLLGNAMKFTAKGEVRLRAEAESPSTVLIEVSDTGIGIEPDQIPMLLTPFAQADASTSRLFGGTGLGLTICAQLAELMGGTLGASSTPGEGSNFWVRLPLPALPADFPPAKRQSATADASVQPSGQMPSDLLAGLSVLVVDDAEVNREVARGMLQRLGCVVHTVPGGQEALDDLAHTSYDVVLLDCVMPVLYGYVTTARLREQEGTDRHTPVVA